MGIRSSDFAKTYLYEQATGRDFRRILATHGPIRRPPMLPYPDISDLPDDLAAALVRLVRLINQLRLRNPDLDRLALSVETELDLRAAIILIRHVEQSGGRFDLILSPWDGRLLLDGPSEPMPPW